MHLKHSNYFLKMTISIHSTAAKLHYNGGMCCMCHRKWNYTEIYSKELRIAISIDLYELFNKSSIIHIYLILFNFYVILYYFAYNNVWYKSAFHCNRYTLGHYKTHVSSLWTYTNEVVSSFYFCDKLLLMCDGFLFSCLLCVSPWYNLLMVQKG